MKLDDGIHNEESKEMTNILKSKQFYVILSLVCAITMFLMSSAFQNMAYWGKGLTWYWIGVSFTYLLWLMGIIFLVIAITRESNKNGKLLFSLSIVGIGSFIILILGFCWTTFVIIAGLSGI